MVPIAVLITLYYAITKAVPDDPEAVVERMVEKLTLRVLNAIIHNLGFIPCSPGVISCPNNCIIYPDNPDTSIVSYIDARFSASIINLPSLRMQLPALYCPKARDQQRQGERSAHDAPPFQLTGFNQQITAGAQNNL
jgi:hypothetical protein